jgi:hypothetical protein
MACYLHLADRRLDPPVGRANVRRAGSHPAGGSGDQARYASASDEQPVRDLHITGDDGVDETDEAGSA